VARSRASGPFPRWFERFDLAFFDHWREGIADPSPSAAQRGPWTLMLVAGRNEPRDDASAFGDGDGLTALAYAIDQGQTLGLELSGRVL
jgi:hypothetical protein